MLRSTLLGLMFWANPTLARQDNVSVKIEATAKHKISAYIYGMGSYLHEDRQSEKIWDLKPTLYRWGGNTSTRFNYKINAWNSANDWFFHNYAAPGRNMIEVFMEENLRHGAASSITLPMLGWVAKDDSSCSFPPLRFPQQDKFEGDCGNGQKNGKNLEADPKRTSLVIHPDFVEGWVKQLKQKFGPFPHFYILDNEPMLWHSTHRDVQALPMTYDGYLQKYLSFAKAVRRADPDAVIIGPAEWGWMGIMNSGMDIEGPWNNNTRGQDRKDHEGKPFLEWFLEKVAAEEKKEKMSLLDVIDVHYYPEKDRWPQGDDKSPAVRKALLQSTRSLWDKDWSDQSWIDEKISFIPRLKAMATRFKPEAKVAIGEYNFRAEWDISGAVAQAESLGIFAREDLFAATYWDYPKKDGTHKYAFELFRNFDGKGGHFADQWVNNSVASQDDYAVFSARDEHRATVVLLNKGTDEQRFELDLSDYPALKSARLISYGQKGPNDMKRSIQKLKTLGKKVSLNTEAMSMNMVELQF